MCRITILHPDLGIGGAERLIVDAALALKNKGHEVNIVTSHFDPSHCFDETRNGELDITVVGDWIPRHIFRRFHALLANIRMVYAAFYITFFSPLKPDVVICDGVAAAVPILKLKLNNIIFYCHFPDKLLSQPGSAMKKVYRIPLDWFEEVCTAKASKIFVNSKFTASVFKNAFKTISVTPDILYPSLNTNYFDSFEDKSDKSSVLDKIQKSSVVFLSINRFERAKHLDLAIHALHELKQKIEPSRWEKVHLVMIGGYDPRLVDNVQYFDELNTLTEKLQLSDKITFLKSPTDSEKIALIKLSTCLIYTPSNEHFGIVPLEAMYLGTPVIAVNNGGPVETVRPNLTGYLCHPTANDFASAMLNFASNPNLKKELGSEGKKHVQQKFSFKRFSNDLDNAITSLVEGKKK